MAVKSVTTETGRAFLVDPMGHAPEALTVDEFEAVRALLDIYRNDYEEPRRGAVRWLLGNATDNPNSDDRAVLNEMLFHYANDLGGCDGILAGVFGESNIEKLTDRELEVLRWTLTAIRAGSWFPEWLALQVQVIAKGSHPDDRHPTPLKIAASLVNCIEEHERRMDAARDMARMRPDLFFPAPVAEPQAKPEPPVAPKAKQRVHRRSAKAPRARKAVSRGR